MHQRKKIIEQRLSLLRQTDHSPEISQEFLDNLYSVYPFNQFEYQISSLIGKGSITLGEYYDIRNEYMSRNKYLYLFEISAPRRFGEIWAQRHLGELVPCLERPNSHLDHSFKGQYDFWYRGIRIEVKASRAVERGSREELPVKALSSDSPLGYDMNFQQLKPSCCDVFVWIAVWRNLIRYWVLSSSEVESNRYYSEGQHRGNKGKEGQLWLKESNISEFAAYEASVAQLLEKIEEKGQTRLASLREVSGGAV